MDGEVGGRAQRPAVGTVDVVLQAEIEQFLYYEAELLDEHRYAEWFELFADDVRYRVPTQENRLRRDRRAGHGDLDGDPEPHLEVALFDDDKTTLGWRVRQLETATHWAEDPPSRTRHLVSNVRVRPASSAGSPAGRLGQSATVRPSLKYADRSIGPPRSRSQSSRSARMAYGS